MLTEHSSNNEKGLPVGTKAPLINTIDVFEKKISFTELYKEHRGVFLDFSRGAWWFYWKKQLSILNQNITEFERRNILVIAISTDKVRPLMKLAEKEGYKFRVISDVEGKISKEYNVFGKPIDYDVIKFELAIPTSYLIDSNGTIVWRYVGYKTDRPSIEAIIDAIDSKL